MANFLDDYEPVEDRLRAFWSDYPTGRVMTTLMHHADGDYIVWAELYREPDSYPAASGMAHDSVDQLPPNMKASALEVCETSAIGRALANLGYAAKGKRPSREEMSKSSPAATPAGEATTEVRPRTPPQAGASTSVIGEEAGEGPGEQTNSPGLTIACNHKSASGKWLPTKQVDGVPTCPRCGANAIVYRESA